MNTARIRHELHYGNRLVRCFIDRPSHVDAMFRQAVQRAPDRVALILGDRQLTYAELERNVDELAAGFVANGLRSGDRLALLLGNNIEFVACVLAAARTGVLVVPLNTRQRSPEIEFVLNQCEAAGLIYGAEFGENVPVRSAIPTVQLIASVGPTADRSFEGLLIPEGGVLPTAIAEEDVFCLLYTSGTTGRPKGAKLTHLGAIHSVMHFEYSMDLRDGQEVSVLAVPGSHVTGLVAVVLTMIRVAGCTVLMPMFKARRFLEIASAVGMTHSLIVPTMYNLCLLDPDFDQFDLSCWLAGGFGGAPMPEATIADLAKRLPQLRLMNFYGSTETTSPATMLPANDLHRADSVGKPLHCVDLIVVDDDGREVRRGESGELWIAGPMIVPGYWDNPEGDEAGFAAGYWRSGDIGSMDEEGYVRIFDRKKDVINRGGFKIYCIEVENVLAHHASVIECAVVGTPDPVLGERVRAVVVTADDVTDEKVLRQFCSERLSDYKVPESIMFLSEPLPRNANGKVLKDTLRATLQGPAPLQHNAR